MFENFYNSSNSIDQQMLEQISLIPTMRRMIKDEIDILQGDIVDLQLDDSNESDKLINFLIRFSKIQSKIEAYKDLLSFLETTRAIVAARNQEN